MKYGGAAAVHIILSAGALEKRCGGTIRADDAAKQLDADALRQWLYTSMQTDASKVICQTWLTRDWSSSGKLLSPVSVEDAIGDRLRGAAFKHRFATEALLQSLAEDLAEGQPPFLLDMQVLRHWYAQYHPDSRPAEYTSAKELEEAMGDEIRRTYPGRCYRTLSSALKRRAGKCKPEIISEGMSHLAWPVYSEEHCNGSCI